MKYSIMATIKGEIYDIAIVRNIYYKGLTIYQKIWGLMSTKSANFQLNNNLFMSSKRTDPKDLFLLQCNGLESNRPDIVIQYLAVKDIVSGSNSEGYALKLYMKYSHCFDTCSDIHADKITALANSFEGLGDNSSNYLICDKQNKIIDGSNKLACALYFGEKTIHVKKTFTIIDQESYWVKLIDAGLSDDEIDFIRDESDLLVECFINDSKTVKNRQFDHKATRKWIAKMQRKCYCAFPDYQSFPMLGIKGKRPTDKRIEQYGLKDILDINMDVLDIGCNNGYMDMEIAHLVRSVTGIEINPFMSKMSKKIAQKLNIYNVAFFSADFKEWESISHRKYDMIFSFANYRWIGLCPKEYVVKITSIIKHAGYIYFEGHDINGYSDEQEEYESYIDAFIKNNFEILKRDYIMDEEYRKRIWTLLQYND